MPTQKDPTTFGYQNFFSTTLTGDITASTLTIGLATVPSPTSGILIIEPDSTSSREVVFYTSKGVSNVTCPSDGRGWAGSTPSAHLTGSAVIMASVDEYFEGLADGTLSTDPIRTSLIQNHIVSGGVVAQSSGLIGTFSNIVFYVNGQRYSGTSIADKTYTASKDTYVDITASSGGTVSVTYSEVANGAAAPALSADYLRVAKVVTNGSAITGVVQYGVDSLANRIYYTTPLNPQQQGIWWEELGRAKLGATGTTISIPGFAARKFLRIEFVTNISGAAWGSGRLRFNSDSGTNYSYRISANNGADSTGTTDGIPVDTGSTGMGGHTMVLNLVNVSSWEKSIQGFVVDSGSAAGSANIPNRRDIFGKWANTSAQITSLSIVNGSPSSLFSANSEVIVLGHD